MESTELTELVHELAERVNELERSAPPASPPDTVLVDQLLRDLTGEGSGAEKAGVVIYAGAGPWGDGTIAWQMGRRWDEVGSAPDEGARVLSALANGTRLRILAELLGGPLATGELADRLEQPSSGQLFHHLKQLMAAGVVHQPVRGTYAIRRAHAVPLLAVLSAASDLSISTGDEPS